MVAVVVAVLSADDVTIVGTAVAGATIVVVAHSVWPIAVATGVGTEVVVIVAIAAVHTRVAAGSTTSECVEAASRIARVVLIVVAEDVVWRQGLVWWVWRGVVGSGGCG